MTDTEKKQIIEIVNLEISKIEKKIEELKEFTDPIAPDNAIGRLSRMDAINNKSIVDASMRNSKNRLNQLKSILRLKNDKSFGLCIKCHKNIPFERLKIRPEVRYCANCLRK